MEKHVAPPKFTTTDRRPWKRSLIELNGRFDSNYRHELYTLVAHSYSEIGKFPHLYHVNKKPCNTHTSAIQFQLSSTMRGVSGLEFDNQGKHIVSVTGSGCLTVHDFETLYCQSKVGPGSAEDESKHVVHFSFPMGKEFDVAIWNPTNQNELACTSGNRDNVLIFDIGCMSPKPTEELETRRKLSITNRRIVRGLSDVAIASDGDSRIFSPDTLGIVHVWDRRSGVTPCIELSIDRYDSINSIQLYVDNQTIFGAGEEGIIHIWDIRGGRNSTVFENWKDVSRTKGEPMSNLPLASLPLAPMLQKTASLKAQSEIVIQSIDVNPSSPHQLAFHLDDGWSGVVDVYKSEVTHLHCPPPAWSANVISRRKPSWLPNSSVYVVGSMTEEGIHVLDFHPSSSSPCHVDYHEDSQSKEKRGEFNHSNKFVSLSETVMGCSAHPLNSMIVAGTKKSSLLLIEQRHCSSTSESVEGEL